MKKEITKTAMLEELERLIEEHKEASCDYVMRGDRKNAKIHSEIMAAFARFFGKIEAAYK